MELSAMDGLGWRLNGIAFFMTAVMLYTASCVEECMRCDMPEKAKHDPSPILQVRVLTAEILDRRRIISMTSVVV